MNSKRLKEATAAVERIFRTAEGLPRGKIAYGFRVEETDNPYPLTWIARTPPRPTPFEDWPMPELGLTLLIGPEGGLDLVTCTVTATTDEKVEAFRQGAAAMRAACMQPAEKEAAYWLGLEQKGEPGTAIPPSRATAQRIASAIKSLPLPEVP